MGLMARDLLRSLNLVHLRLCAEVLSLRHIGCPFEDDALIETETEAFEDDADLDEEEADDDEGYF